jgi:hypothetical protein
MVEVRLGKVLPFESLENLSEASLTGMNAILQE